MNYADHKYSGWVRQISAPLLRRVLRNLFTSGGVRGKKRSLDQLFIICLKGLPFQEIEKGKAPQVIEIAPVILQ
jgi:hypothetical protein